MKSITQAILADKMNTAMTAALSEGMSRTDILVASGAALANFVDETCSPEGATAKMAAVSLVSFEMMNTMMDMDAGKATGFVAVVGEEAAGL